MKHMHANKAREHVAESRDVAVPLAQQKMAVKQISKSANTRSVSSGSFAFVPASAPVQVRRWPKF